MRSIEWMVQLQRSSYLNFSKLQQHHMVFLKMDDIMMVSKIGGIGESNYIPAATRGCHISHGQSNWIVGTSPFSYEDFGLDISGECEVCALDHHVSCSQIIFQLPDMSIDPSDGLLSLINTSASTKSYFITIDASLVVDANGCVLHGAVCCVDGVTDTCTTLVCVLGPLQTMDVCYIQGSVEDLKLVTQIFIA